MLSKLFVASMVVAAAAAGGLRDPKTFKVSPGAEGGLKISPMPGQNDPDVHTRARADYAETVKKTAQYLGDHSYKDDIRELLKEVDKSENVQKGLKLRVVEKENFIDSLVQREDLLQSDVNKDKQALSNLKAHITAMRARIEKLKKTKQIAELQSQYNEYKHASDSLKSQAEQLSSVKSALEHKISALKTDAEELNKKEVENMKESISDSPSGPAGDVSSSGASGASGAAEEPASPESKKSED